MKNKPHYSRKSEIALKWSVTWLVAMVVTAFLAFVYFRPEPEWVKGWICTILSVMSAIGCYSQGVESSRCSKIHRNLTK